MNVSWSPLQLQRKPSHYLPLAKDRALAANHTLRCQYNKLDLGKSFQMQLQLFLPVLALLQLCWRALGRASRRQTGVYRNRMCLYPMSHRIYENTSPYIQNQFYSELGIKSLRHGWSGAALFGAAVRLACG